MFDFWDHILAASHHRELVIWYFIGLEYTADLPQAAIVEWTDIVHVAFGYLPAFSPIQKNRLDQSVKQAYLGFKADGLPDAM